MYGVLDLTNSAGGAKDLLSNMGVGGFLASLIIALLYIVSMWKIFTKAGKQGWIAIIPIVNTVVLFKIADLNPWLLLLYLIPIVNIFAIIITAIILEVNLAKNFGKSGGFAVGLIFLNVIFMPILAFSDAKYKSIENK